MRLGIVAAAASLGVAALGAAAMAQPASPFPPGYEQAYRAYIAALPPAGRSLDWLTRLKGVASQPADLTMGGLKLTYLFACKEHGCDANNVNVFLMPDRRQARAVIRINGVQTLIGGAGPAEVACVKKLDASGGTAATC